MNSITHTFTVSGIKCAGCEQNIINTLRVLTGVEQVTANHTTQQVSVCFITEQISLDTLALSLNNAGYHVQF
jgi:copper chaperone CopZ